MRIRIRRILTTVSLVAGCLLGWGGYAHAEQQSYLLACKGMGSFEGLEVSSPWPDVNHATFVYQFKKSAGKATEGLRKGECAWIDRPLNASEPSKMIYAQEDVVVITTLGGPKKPISLDVRNKTQANPAHLQPLKRMLRSMSNGDEFQVQAYTSKSGVLRVTQIGL